MVTHTLQSPSFFLGLTLMHSIAERLSFGAYCCPTIGLLIKSPLSQVAELQAQAVLLSRAAACPKVELHLFVTREAGLLSASLLLEEGPEIVVDGEEPLQSHNQVLSLHSCCYSLCLCHHYYSHQ